MSRRSSKERSDSVDKFSTAFTTSVVAIGVSVFVIWIVLCLSIKLKKNRAEYLCFLMRPIYAVVINDFCSIKDTNFVATIMNCLSKGAVFSLLIHVQDVSGRPKSSGELQDLVKGVEKSPESKDWIGNNFSNAYRSKISHIEHKYLY